MTQQPKHNEHLEELDISLLHPHPDNPRIAPREDVITAIVANLGDEYPKKHALRVRGHGDGYEILGGQHRWEAAKRKGLQKVWCWVEDMDDEAARMELVLDNMQGELSPLEIGMHALKAVPKAEGGRGKTGGLSEYGKRLGMSVQYVSQIRQAAEVITAAKERNPQVDLKVFHDKTQHLAALHQLPVEQWSEAVEWLVAQGDPPLSRVQQHVRSELKRIAAESEGTADIAKRGADEEAMYRVAVDEMTRIKTQEFAQDVRNVQEGTRKRGDSFRTEALNTMGVETEAAARAEAERVGRSLGTKEGSPVAKYHETPGEIAAAIEHGNSTLSRAISRDFRESVEAQYGPDIRKSSYKGHIDALKQLHAMMTIEEQHVGYAELVDLTSDFGDSIHKQGRKVDAEPLRIEQFRRSLLAAKPEEQDAIMNELEEGTRIAFRREIWRVTFMTRGVKVRGARRLHKYTVEEAVQLLSAVNDLIYERAS